MGMDKTGAPQAALKLNMMNERPKIKLALNGTDKMIEFLACASLLAFWVFTIASYSDLPDTIPVHYDGAGEADGFGGKGNILALPIIATILFTGLTFLNKFPHIFNYPASITADNALRQYTLATRMIRYLKFIIIVIFGLIAWQTIRNASGETTGLGVWFLPTALGLIIIPITYFMAKALKTSKR